MFKFKNLDTMKKEELTLVFDENKLSEKIASKREKIWLEFNTATNCFMLQNQQGIDKSLYIAKVNYEYLEKKLNEQEDIRFEKCILLYVEAISKYLKGYLYMLNQNLPKAYDEFLEGKTISDEGVMLSQSLLFEVDESDTAVFPKINICNITFQYFSFVINILANICYKGVQILGGKLIDEVKFLQTASEELSNFNFSPQLIINDDNIQYVSGLKGQLNQFAEIYDNMAQKIIETRKTAQFIRPYNNKVFIIHGHDEARLRELENILNDFDLEPVILKNEIDNGKTVIEKLEDYGKECGFAFAIITPDDIVYNKDKKVFQARPNVLYELGWFMGRYGRSKVRLLCKFGTALPSDLSGIVNIEYNDKLEEVYRKIKTDLETAGILEKSEQAKSNKILN